MNNKISYAALALSVVALFVAFSHPAGNLEGQQPKKETAYERIMRTGTVRCGYVVYPPYIIRDPNTGKLSGVFYDYTQKIGDLAGLKIDWNAETDYLTFITDMEKGRYDVYCGGLWADTNQAKTLDYSIATNYNGIGVYVRADDHRFDQNPDSLNDPQFKFASIDGDTSQIVLRDVFPKASQVSMPNITDVTMLAENVKTGKADATIMGEIVGNGYLEANPGSLRNIYKDQPVKVYENLYAFTPTKDSQSLVTMFNVAIKELLYSGALDAMTAKYMKKPNDFYPVALPYKPVKAD
jgi:ABC-type amino acid transport substrate-binding protein